MTTGPMNEQSSFIQVSKSELDAFVAGYPRKLHCGEFDIFGVGPITYWSDPGDGNSLSACIVAVMRIEDNAENPTVSGHACGIQEAALMQMAQLQASDTNAEKTRLFMKCYHEQFGSVFPWGLAFYMEMVGGAWEDMPAYLYLLNPGDPTAEQIEAVHAAIAAHKQNRKEA